MLYTNVTSKNPAEANTLPGMTPTSLLPQEAAVIGMNFNELCEKLIAISLKKYEG